MTLSVTGLVSQPLDFEHERLASMPGQIPDVGALAPGRKGAAAPFRAVLEAVSPQADAAFITLEADGGFSASVPLAAVADQALLLYALDGKPLPEDQGGPVRFLIPDPAACGTDEVDQCANVKWLNAIRFSAERGRDVRPTTLRAHEELHEAERRARAKQGGA